MPKGYPKNRQPAEGGAVMVAEPIKDMLAPGSEKNFFDSLPEQTSSEDQSLPDEPKIRKKRRTKEEMARSRGDAAEAPVDKRLERAKAKAAGLGGAKLVAGGFAAAQKPLNDEEAEDVDDQFYLISHKAGIDPSGSWLFLIVYTIALLGRLILVRTELGEEVAKFVKQLFEKKEEDKEKKAKEAKEWAEANSK